MYEKIFVPIDDSAAATKALKEAIGLAKACNSKLVLTHVVDLSQFGWGGTGFMQSKEVRDVTKEVGAKIMEHAKEVLDALGSVAEGVLKSVEVPVMFLRQNER